MSVQAYDWSALKKIYLGKSGSGKTTLFWEHFTKEKARIKFLYDHKAMEFSRRYLKELPAFTAEEFMQRVQSVLDGKRGNKMVAFCPSKMFPGKADTGFEFFCEIVFAICEQFKGRKLLGCDELQKLVDERAKPEPLLNICDIGRTYQIDCFFIASASNAIHNRVRGQMTEAFCFLHGDKNACQWESENGFPIDELLSLKKGEYLWRNLDTGEAQAGGKAF